MSMKNVTTEHWSVEEANQRLQKDFDASYWEFLIRTLSYNDVSFTEGHVIFPAFVPLRELLDEVLTRIDSGGIAVAPCQVCQTVYDINKEPGIFGDPTELAHFICGACASDMSAKEFYDNHLKV